MPAPHAVDDASRQIAARIELHPIQSLTLSDRDFLLGDAAGTPVTICGELRIAQGTGRLPIVVLQHGSSGPAANIDVWSRELNALGVSTFALDGFTGRGLIELNSNHTLLGRLNLILDIYRALEILAEHPRVDPDRIAVMGFSRGGQAALYASLRRFHRLWNRSGVGFAAYFPFYPDCMTTYVDDTDTADSPIRVFVGAADDYNAAAACRAYVQRLKAAGRDADLTEYAGATHAFDNPLGAFPPAVQPSWHCHVDGLWPERSGWAKLAG
jgi:dienelactone hydrolase